ncbi:unnamed protein product [Ambrosiozyma monospora]|uniref:Unnamed protein product n=1 Tax=Ambrosiozyma monospora TaxID=43982 RepID=A0A9W6YYA0_AMBMO|nr:unnamed protein product [Ambrosiozyma monospora]
MKICLAWALGNGHMWVSVTTLHELDGNFKKFVCILQLISKDRELGTWNLELGTWKKPREGENKEVLKGIEANWETSQRKKDDRVRDHPLDKHVSAIVPASSIYNLLDPLVPYYISKLLPDELH